MDNLYGFENIMYLLFIPIMIGLVYAFFQMRLIFGGADAKALMAIAILTPLEPSISQFPLWSGSFMPFSWSIFSNSIIVFLFIPLSLLIFNIVKRNIQFPYVVLGYKMDIKTARNKFVWPLEKLVDGKRKFVYMPNSFDVNDEYDYFNDLEMWFPKSQVKFKKSVNKKYYHFILPEWLYLAKMEELKIRVE